MAEESSLFDDDLMVIRKCLLRSKDALVVDAGHLPTHIMARLGTEQESESLQQLLEQASKPSMQCYVTQQGRVQYNVVQRTVRSTTLWSTIIM